MQDIPRTAFILIADVFVVAFLIMLLAGCVATPTRNQFRNGDFDSHMASSKEAEGTADVVQMHGPRSDASERIAYYPAV
jgi:hypothetical protein